MQGKTFISNTILPKVNIDFVSYSSYKPIQNKDYNGKKVT